MNPNNNINENKILFKNTPLNKENNINNKFNLNIDNKKENITSKNINNDLRNLQVKSFNLFNNETQKENVNKQYEEETNSELLSFRNEIDTSINSQCTFRVSSIENGIALLVNSQNYIFTLPTILLPKSVKIGNEYNFFIEETLLL